MVRDEEIQRLINYTKGLGLKITFSSKKGGDAAAWVLDNSEIVIYNSKKTPKIDMVLALIHELGHAVHNIHEKNRQVDLRFDEAIGHVDDAEEFETDTKKRQRKVILDNERAGSLYWDVIYKDTNMKFPLWRLESAREYDIWQYEVFYETGRFPRKKDRIEKLKALNRKYRK